MKLVKPICYFDLETTGLDIGNDRIIQIAMVRVGTDGSRMEYKSLVNPGDRIISPSAQQVHGITNEMVKDAPKLEQISSTIIEYLRDADVSGYNIRSFDIPMLSEELFRVGHSWPFDESMKVIDGIDLFRKINPHSLENAYKMFVSQDGFDGAHDALNDVIATIDVVNAISNTMQCEDSHAASDEGSEGKDFPDFVGKLCTKDGKICFNFGKMSGDAVKENPGAASWCLKQSFVPEITKRIIRKELGYKS